MWIISRSRGESVCAGVSNPAFAAVELNATDLIVTPSAVQFDGLIEKMLSKS